MESEGGGIVAATAPAPAPATPRRLSTQHSTLQDSFIASDLADGLTSPIVVNHNHDPVSPRPVSSLTLGAVLNRDKKSPPANNIIVRTLLEIIHNDETLNIGGVSPNRKKSWRTFKEKLKHKKRIIRNNRSCSPSMPIPQSDILPISRSNSLRNSLRSNSIRIVDSFPADDVTLMEVDSGGSPRTGDSFRLSAALAAEQEQTRRRCSRELEENGIDVSGLSAEGNGPADEEAGDEAGPSLGALLNQPVRMSLMDLLEETDRQAGISGPAYRLGGDVEEDEVEEEEVVEEAIGKGEFSCCVCLVRHKGAAFIPCGHTFCRLCSRELFVQRGNCPLCNNFIVEILNIF